MSEADVETARAMREALIQGGPDAAAEFLHPDVVFDVATGHFEGLEGMSRWFRTIVKYLVDYEIAGSEFFDAGEGAVIANNIMRARGARSPLATQDQIYLLRFKDGKVSQVTRYPTKEAALVAAREAF